MEPETVQLPPQRQFLQQQAFQLLELQVPRLDRSTSGARFDAWGFAHAHSLEELYSNVVGAQDGEDQEGYIAALHASRAFASPYCIDAMAKAYGLSELLVGLSGSLLTPPAPGGCSLATKQIRGAINHAWSDEALRRGVEAAKSGLHDAALASYHKALDLNPSNTDALVARGAALANQGSFPAAVEDFRAALRLQPDNANAARYMSATLDHMQQQQGQMGPEPGHPERHRGRVREPAVVGSPGRAGRSRTTADRQGASSQQQLGSSSRMGGLSGRRSSSCPRGRGRGSSMDSKPSSSSSSSSSSTDGDEEGDGRGRPGAGKLSHPLTARDVQEALAMVRGSAGRSSSSRRRHRSSHKEARKSRDHKKKKKKHKGKHKRGKHKH